MCVLCVLCVRVCVAELCHICIVEDNHLTYSDVLCMGGCWRKAQRRSRGCVVLLVFVFVCVCVCVRVCVGVGVGGMVAECVCVCVSLSPPGPSGVPVCEVGFLVGG